jgi:2-desacetyl-2-hydroxyethyl bacteriochlorophyllide A dehydrogenase
MAELREELVAPPGPGELRVRALASGVSQGTELLVYRGEVRPDLPLDLPTLAGSFAFPIKHGYAAVGGVLDVGGDVAGFAPGDLVFAHHPHQSLYVVPAGSAVRLPCGISPELGVFLANLETAVNVLLDTPLHLGETAVVLGQGIVGLLITQLLKLAGACHVVAVEPLVARRAAALRVGADYALSPEEEIVQRVRELTDGRGADVAIEVSGTCAGLQAAIEAVADEGTVVAVSWYGAKPVMLDLGGHFHRGRVTLRSSQVGRTAPALAPRWDRARRMALAVGLLPRLHLAELISHHLPFARATEAYRLLDKRPEEALQVVLTYDGE